MIKVSDIRNTVRKGLAAYLGVTTIIAEQGGPQPKYPFATLKAIVVGEKEGRASVYTVSGKQRRDQYIRMTFSLSCYSDDIDVANDLAYKALEYFESDGHTPLRDNGVVVVHTYPLEDRTTFLVTDYEYRIGFDVEVRVKSRTEKEIEETIESIDISQED